MATSGSFNTTAITIENNQTRYLTFSWTRSSYSVENNTSTISWTLKGAGTYGQGSSYWVYVKNVTLVVNGTTYTYCSEPTKVTSGGTVASGTMTITHSSDGTKSFSASCSAGIYSSYDPPNSTGSATFTLDTIPRATTSCTASNVTSGNNCSIKWTPLNSSFRFKIKFVMGSVSYTTGYISPNQTTQYTYTGYSMTAATWGPAIPNATSGTVTVTLYTYTSSSSTAVGNCSTTFTYTLASTVIPTVSTVTPSNVGTVTTYGYLQNYSKVRVQSVGSGVAGSTITKYTVSVNSQTLTGSDVTSNVLKTSGSNTISVTATDSRGRVSSAKTTTITVVAYSAPKITNFNASRCTSSGTTDDSGDYLHVTGSTTHTRLSGATDGTTVQYKKTSASSWSTLISRTTTASYTLPSTTTAAADTESSYQVKITVTDGVTTITQTQSVPTVFVLMDWLNDGHGMAIGKVSETTNLLDISLPTMFRNKVTLFPVNSVVCMATNTNPSSYLGGTWELIDKEFSSYYNYTDTSNFTKSNVITSVTDPVISRSGHSVTLKITFVNTNALSGTNTTVGTWDWSKVGISAIGYTQVFIGLAEGYGILQMDIASSTGVMRVIDVVARTGSVSGSTSSNSPIAAGVTCYAEATFTVDKSRMLDSACDKFYFKRTA